MELNPVAGSVTAPPTQLSLRGDKKPLALTRLMEPQVVESRVSQAATIFRGKGLGKDGNDCEPLRKTRPEGFEPPTDGLEISRNVQDSTGKTGISQVIGPPTGPRSLNGQKTSSVEGQFLAADDDQELSQVINAWHSLAEPIRRAILALVGAASD